MSRRLVVFLLSLTLALTTFSFVDGIGFANEADQSGTEAAGQKTEQGVPDADNAPENADADNESGDTDSDKGTDGNIDSEKGKDGNTNSDSVDKKDVEVPPDEEESAGPILKAPSREMPSGNVSNGWKWKVTGEEGDYTLEFEYTGEASPTPSLTIPANFYSSISDNLGEAKGKIKAIEFPDETKSIGNNAFKGVESVETVNLASTNVSTIGSSAFQGCSGLTGVKFPSSLTSIGDSAFEGDTALRTADFSRLQANDVTYSDTNGPSPKLELGNRVFAGSGVTSVSLPDQTNKVGKEVFLNCKSLKNADMPAFSYFPMDSNTGVSMFSGCTALENLTFRSVEGRNHYYKSNNTYLNRFPNSVLDGCTSLEKLDMSGYKGQKKDTFQFRTVFEGSDLSSLQELILPVEPEKQIALNTAFTGKDGLKSLSVIKNPESISSMDSKAFMNSGIKNADMTDWTGISAIPASAFSNCEELTKAVIPENVTSIGNMAFANDPALTRVEVRTKELTSVGSNIFEGDSALKTLAIGKEVNKLNGNIFSYIGDESGVIFEGENLLTITKPSVAGSQLPLRNLNGNYFADSKGVLYKLDDDGTATLAYIPPELEGYTVPATIHTPDGNDYSVDAVGAYCCAMADDLTALTFEDSSKVSIPGSAFKGWTTSSSAGGKTINGKTVITPSEWKSVSNMCSYPLGDESSTAQRVPEIEETIIGADGKTPVIKTYIIPEKDHLGEEDGIYHYKTGESAKYGIAISNQDSVVMEKIVRIYFEFSNDGYEMKFSEGVHNLVDTAGNSFRMNVVKSSEPNVWYYELQEIDANKTVGFEDYSNYPSPSTAGGTLRVWTTTLTKEQAEATEGKVIDSDKYIEFEWSTDPVGRDLAKVKNNVYGQGNPKITTTTDGRLYVNNLMYRITESNHPNPPNSNGADYIKSIVYEDTLEPPDGIYWEPAVLNAIKMGQTTATGGSGWYLSTSTEWQTFSDSSSVRVYPLFARVNGNSIPVAYIHSPNFYDSVSSPNHSKITDITPAVVTDENGKETVKLRWRLNNPYTSSQFPISTFYVKYGNSVLRADSDAVNNGMGDKDDGTVELFKIPNKIDETRYYNYSPKQHAEAKAVAGVEGSAAFSATKAYTSSSNSALGGNPMYTYVTMRNTGIVDLTRWGDPTGQLDAQGRQIRNGNIITDTLNYLTYITPEDIEKMLNATAKTESGSSSQEYPVGDWLTITINKASLFDPELYAPSEGYDQSGKYSTTNIAATNDNSYRVYEKASFKITKNAEGVIEVTLSGDTIAANNKTYTIGAGQDFKSVKELFDHLGYMPTNGTTYNLSWTVDEGGFVLHPTQSMRINILSSMKTTPMLLTADRATYRPDRYSSTNPYSNFEFRNYATVRSQLGNRSVNTGYMYWKHELSIDKGATVEGTSSSNGITEGSVVDYYISGTNTNGIAYDTMSMHDMMTGAQVLLVPVSLNPDLKAADGSNLEKYTSNGVEYWLLNKAGTYTNVNVGRNTKNDTGTTQNYTAEKIIVSTSTSGVRTEIHWKSFENWGGTNSANRIYYKALIGTEHSGAGSTSTNPQNLSYPVNNRAWLGDHQGHRLYYDRNYGYTIAMYSYSKKIIAEEGAKDGTDPASMLLDHSRVHHGQTVTYQMQLNNISGRTMTISGDRLKDLLPDTYGVFAWTRGDDEHDANVTNLRYYGTDGVTIRTNKGGIDTHGDVSAGNDDYWHIDKNSSDSTYYTVYWNNDFAINIPKDGNVKILVDVTYPESNENDDTWDKYVAKNKAGTIYNDFYVDSNRARVSHVLESGGYPVLYKGVFNSGLTTKTGSSSYKYTSNRSRLMYSNGPDQNDPNNYNMKASTLTYYTVVYNGSYDRMYLSDIQDLLPRGFKFNGLVNTAGNTTGTNTSSNVYVGYSTYEKNTISTEYRYQSNSTLTPKLLSLSNSNDQRDNNAIKYVNAKITATKSNVTINGETKQRLTFKLEPSSSGYSSVALKKDSAANKYYLAPGEAIRFGYNVEIGSYANTDDIATNTAAMPYYDYYGTDFDLNVPDKEGKGGVRRTITAADGIRKNNDGGCETMTADDVSSKYSFNVSNYTDAKYNNHDGGNWLVSHVDVERSDIVPGIQKTVGGISKRPAGSSVPGPSGTSYGTAYSSGCMTDDIVNWKVRVYNEGGAGDEDVHQMMTNYTLVDTMAEPYGFTGRVQYDTYNANGTRSTMSTVSLFTIGKRGQDDSTIKIASGNSDTPSNTLRIGNADDPSDDDANWYTFGTGDKAGKVRIERNRAGKETMTIVLEGIEWSIPAGFYNQFRISTQYTREGEDVLSEGKYNDVVVYPVQDYDPTKVAQGRARTVEGMDDEGNVVTKNDGVQSGTSIILTLGYETESWKTVTQKSNSSNTAHSQEGGHYINLTEKSEPFRYDLFMIAPENKTSRVVFIDNLPQDGDHTTFVKEEKRDSDYTVSFLEENPDFQVTVAPSKGGTQHALTKDQYKLFVSDKTEFEEPDWKPGTAAYDQGWTDITDYTDEQLKQILPTARSLRVEINDPKALDKNASTDELLISYKSQIHVSFNAKVNDKNALPGQYAWNNFAYNYDIPIATSVLTLGAQTHKVGVRFPPAPRLTKKLTEEVEEVKETTDPESGEPTTETVTKVVPHASEKDLTCKFIIYEGEPLESLNNITGKKDSEIAEILSDAKKKYIYIPLEVKAGQSEAMQGLWTVDYCYKYVPGEGDKEGKFVEDTDKQWKWINDAKYTLLELNMPAEDIYELHSLTIDGKEFTGDNNRVFANTSGKIVELAADNRYSTTDLILTKKMPTRVDTSLSEKGKTNSTVVFKIEGKNKSGKVVYKNTVGLSFDSTTGASETKVLHDVPSDITLTVKEVYSGNYEPKDITITKTSVEEYEGDLEEYKGKKVWLFEFNNELKDNDFSSGIVNKYEFKDGKIQYINDGGSDDTGPGDQPLEPAEEPKQ